MAQTLPLAALAASCAALGVYWYMLIAGSFTADAFAHHTGTDRYVLFIGSFSYIILLHALNMFIGPPRSG